MPMDPYMTARPCAAVPQELDVLAHEAAMHVKVQAAADAAGRSACFPRLQELLYARDPTNPASSKLVISGILMELGDASLASLQR